MVCQCTSTLQIAICRFNTPVWRTKRDEHMTDSYYETLLLEGRAKQLQELAGLASKDRSPTEAKRFAAEAQAILRNLAELDEKLSITEGLSGLDYRDDAEMNVAVIRFLSTIDRPATEGEITKELIRGRFRGYKDERKMAIRVGRCIRSYQLAKASENPKLKARNERVGLVEWPDKMFS
jgi:hypothetical protein